MVLTTGNFTAGNGIFIDDAHNVGIGTNIPTTLLHAFKGDSGGADPNTNAVLTLENNNNGYIQFLSGVSHEQGILFGDTDNEAGSIVYQHSNNTLRFKTNGTSDQLVIKEAGASTHGVEISGDLTIGKVVEDASLDTVLVIDSSGLVKKKKSNRKFNY